MKAARYTIGDSYIVDTEEMTISVPPSVDEKDYPDIVKKLLNRDNYRKQLNLL